MESWHKAVSGDDFKVITRELVKKACVKKNDEELLMGQ